MSTYSQEGQLNPDLPPDPQPTNSVERVVRALEENKAAVDRWFWKGLLAFNLVLWSLTLAVWFLRHS